MSCALVAIAKMEHRYIVEWVQYYLHIGFDAIYVYENDDIAMYAKMLESYPQVTVIPFPGPGTPETSIQVLMLQHFCENFKDKYKWIAHFDCDEFLVLKKHKSIHDVCNEYLGNNEGGLAVTWAFFGSNDQILYKPEPVTFRFTKREKNSPTTLTDCKTIVCVSCLEKYIDYHMPILHTGHIRNTNGEILTSKPTYQVNDILQLNHYFCKSYEEFARRRVRGQAGVPSTDPRKLSKGPKARAGVYYYEMCNKNEEEDLLAKQIYEECLTKIKTQE